MIDLLFSSLKIFCPKVALIQDQSLINVGLHDLIFLPQQT